MNSYLFQEGSAIAPAPLEYGAFDERRAVWVALGRRPDQISAREYGEAVIFLQAEARARRRKDS